MKITRNGKKVPWALMIRSANVLGLVVSGIILHEFVLAHLRAFARHDALYVAVALAMLVLAALAPVLVRQMIERGRRMDQGFLDAFFKHSADSVFFKDAESRFVCMSDSLARRCRLKSPADALGKTDADLFSEDHAARALADEREIIRTGQPIFAKEERETWPDGRETWVLTTRLPLMDGHGRMIGTMGISHDVTDRKQAESQVHHVQLHDPLTGLPNRQLLQDGLHKAIRTAQPDGRNVAVLLIGIDRFKYVNESMGHSAGDRLLEIVAARLRQCTRATDTVARLCGDEFVLAVPDISNNEDIEGLARKVLGSLSKPLELEGQELQVTASMGISQFPENGGDVEALLRYADAAMHDAKRKGRGRFSFFSSAMSESAEKQRKLESDLLNACSRDEFVVHYQPIVDSDSGRITAMEALLRWKHPQQGLISPGQFIPLLEELGLMNEAGRWVLQTACRQAAEWRDQGFPAIRVAVNVSPQQFYEGNLAETIDSMLRETRLDASQLELELTESRTLDDSEATIAIMRRLKAIGVSLSLDDFGTGWSSLSYLRQFPLDRIKIDRAFVRDLATQPKAAGMVRSILSLAQDLSFASIAEGVETSYQRDVLKKLNCPELQGFFFSRPLPVVEATGLLSSAKLAAKAQSAEPGLKAASFSSTGIPVQLGQSADGKRSLVH